MNIPAKLSGFRSRVINGLIDAIRAREVVDSQDIVARVTTGGTQLRLRETYPDKGYPWGSDRFLWGVDQISSDTLYIGDGALLYQTFQSALSQKLCDGATITVTNDTQYIQWEGTCQGLPTDFSDLAIRTTPSLSASYDVYNDGTNKAYGPLYKVTSRVVDSVRIITGVIPYQFGPLIVPFMPNGVTDGDSLAWNGTQRRWVPYTPS